MKNKILIILAVSLASATACNDWLDVKPRTEQTADDMFETYQGYKDALIGCYMKMKARGLYGEHLTMTTIEYLAQHWDFGGGYNGNLADPAKKWDYEDFYLKAEVKNIYSGLYNVIVQANDILAALPKTGETAIKHADTRAIFEGEALALRAFCHFDILRLFGQMPSGGAKKVKLPYSENVSFDPVAYYDYAAFCAKIEKDLLAAEKLLLESDPFVPYSRTTVNASDYNYSLHNPDLFLRYRPLRLNYWAVKALEARFYLYTGQTRKAHAAALAVINARNQDETGKFALSDITDQTTRFALPDETLFALNSPDMKDYIPVLFRRENSTRIYLYMSPEKLETMFGEPEETSTNNRYKYLWDHEVYIGDGVYCPVLKKYDQSNLSGSVLDQMLKEQIIPLLRLSEVYLIAMETSDDMAEINALYDTYRIKRNIVGTTFSSKDEVMEMIIDEYRRELFGEGQMFFTYKRTGAGRMLWTDDENTVVGESAYVLPLPATEYDPNI